MSDDDEDCDRGTAAASVGGMLSPLTSDVGDAGSCDPVTRRLPPVIRGELVGARPVSLEQRKLDVIRRADERVRRKATSIVEHALAGAEIDDPVRDGEDVVMPPKRPEGWSDRKFRIAQDARRDEKHTPAYLKMATRVLESYKRADAGQVAPPTLGADIKVYVANATFSYPVRDVTDDGDK